MLLHRNMKALKLFVLSLILLVAAAACDGVPEDLFGIWVNMDSVGTTEDGVDYDRNDILFTNILTDTIGTNWVVAFDGEQYGLTDKKHDIAGFSFNKYVIPTDLLTSAVTDQEIFLSFEANRSRLPGITDWVMGNDIVKFKMDTSGPEPVYSYEVYFDGSDVGLSTNAEKVDGITVWPKEYIDSFEEREVNLPYDCHAGVIFISTRGKYRVPDNLGGSLVGDGSDVLAFCATNTGADTAGFWFRVFDGSEAGLKQPNAMSGLDVFLAGYTPGVTEEFGDSEFSTAFFFVARKPFKTNDDVSGNPSELFVGLSESDMGLHQIVGPVSDFNNDIGAPALNGVVESLSLFDLFVSVD